LLALTLATATAQQVYLPSGNVSSTGIDYGSIGGTFNAVDPTSPLPIGGKQESYTLATANASSAAQNLYGGYYIVTQNCSVYGSLTLEVLDPDNAT
jgi:hypothetical protein